jgi:predicted ATPase
MKTIALVYATHLEWILGYPDRALRTKRAMDEWVERLDHPFMYAFAYTWGAAVHLYRGDIEQHRAQVAKGQKISHQIGFAHFEWQADVWVGWNAETRGMGDEVNLAVLGKGIANYVNTGSAIALPFLKVLHAEVLLRRGDTGCALAVLEETRAQVEASGEMSHAAEIERVCGEALLRHRQEDAKRAEQALQRALELSRTQDAKSWELRASASLARLWASQGRRTDAYDLLRAVYGWFTEGFDTRDLRDAKALLEELSRPRSSLAMKGHG